MTNWEVTMTRASKMALSINAIGFVFFFYFYIVYETALFDEKL